MSARVLLITASSGIGAATAELARHRGWAVFTAALENAGYCGDLTQPSAADEAFAAALASHGKVDAVFNVAGSSGRRFGDGPLHECTDAGLEATMRANLIPMLSISRAAIRHWLGQGSQGVILNMASVLAFSPEPKHFASHAYAASKGAIVAMTRSAAAYYAPSGIRINAIAPGLTRTPMSARAQGDDAIQEFIRAKQPLASGMLESADVARTALFLLGEESAQITGQVITVDGGWSVTT